ncbi:LON peptidase substrate-binding domain-containing protein [Ferrimonas senticii]|uniref:LON peptidase substrate-binding domain-containing protein n=1 Tax=Ferrimonas senticii TaxID=394566 RepID=UPI00041BD9DE|nr:LON peptidase substrate-binding domain-containing protein [Ferrimonas senticii]
MQQFAELPLFPLTSQVFPGGRLPLRIFEPRYLRMIKESLQRGHGFAVCMLNEQGNKDDNSHIYPFATRVEVVDFDQLEGGMLGVTVAGLERLQIGPIRSQSDGLRVGSATVLPQWPQLAIKPQQLLVAEQLQRVYEAYQDLAQLYPEPHFDDATWVAQRWLEILPLSGEDKHRLWQLDSPNPTLQLIDSMLKNSNQ